MYRSRLAEAYCASRHVPGVQPLSSGILAELNSDSLISPYAAEVLIRYRGLPPSAHKWQQTTQALVKMSDVLVFMESEHRRFCENWIEPNRQRVEVWEIEDVGPMDAEKIAEKVERTFGMIRRRTDMLLAALGRGSEGDDIEILDMP
jgi:protein-tyrosine-phosphatase